MILTANENVTFVNQQREFSTKRGYMSKVSHFKSAKGYCHSYSVFEHTKSYITRCPVRPRISLVYQYRYTRFIRANDDTCMIIGTNM
jgi:hypothetical protein